MIADTIFDWQTAREHVCVCKSDEGTRERENERNRVCNESHCATEEIFLISLGTSLSYFRFIFHRGFIVHSFADIRKASCRLDGSVSLQTLFFFLHLIRRRFEDLCVLESFISYHRSIGVIYKTSKIYNIIENNTWISRKNDLRIRYVLKRNEI